MLQRAEVPGIAVGVHPTVDAAVHAALGGTGGTGPPTQDQRRGDPSTGTSPARSAPDTDRDGMVGDGD